MDIQVRINHEGALRNQRFAFTDRFTLVTELLQNARRAGATLIVIIHDEQAVAGVIATTLKLMDYPSVYILE